MSTTPSNVILIGFMGSGKSSVGKLVAKKLGFQFLDSDAVLVERAGQEISEIFAQHGEAHFRNLETAVLESFSLLNRCVIATGGGIVVRPENRALLRQLGFVVLLTADEEVIFERVSRNTKRPLVQTENPRETVAQMLAVRQPLYHEVAQFTVDNSRITHAEAADAIITAARQAFSWHSAA